MSTFAIPFSLGQHNTPYGVIDIRYGMVLAGDFNAGLYEDDLLDLVAGVAYEVFPPEEDDDSDFEPFDIYKYQMEDYVDGHHVALKVTISNEVVVYIDDDVDRVDIDPRVGARIIRQLKTWFKDYVTTGEHTLFAMPNEADGYGDRRIKFFKKLGFIDDPDCWGCLKYIS